ncbi:MAG TPA: DUF1080 domain-containing protein [Opitutaceae bacterium]|nr:DUF1080 domain-containing protein [Opitutaceae bacterium]
MKPHHLRFSAVFVVASMLPGAAKAAETWKPLFNGRNLDGWEMFMTVPDPSWEVPGLKRDASGRYLEPIGKNSDPLHVFTIETVAGRPAIHVSGQGFGVITTRESFANFHLRLQVKWGERKWGSKLNQPRDAGLLYFVHGEPGFDHATWPRSVEFQIQEHDIGDLYALGTQITVRARPEGRWRLYDPRGQPTLFVQKPPVGNRCVKLGDPEKPKGEWNTLDLYCFGSDSVHVVNGVVVMRLHQAQRIDGPEPRPLSEGRISLQTEGAEVYYRDVEITALDAIPAEFAEN